MPIEDRRRTNPAPGAGRPTATAERRPEDLLRTMFADSVGHQAPARVDVGAAPAGRRAAPGHQGPRAGQNRPGAPLGMGGQADVAEARARMAGIAGAAQAHPAVQAAAQAAGRVLGRHLHARDRLSDAATARHAAVDVARQPVDPPTPGRAGTGAPEPRVRDHLPMVITRALARQPEPGQPGPFNPRWSQVRHLPGYLVEPIRAVGRQLLGSMGGDALETMQVLATVLGQGPNPASDVQRMARWLQRHATELDKAQATLGGTPAAEIEWEIVAAARANVGHLAGPAGRAGAGGRAAVPARAIAPAGRIAGGMPLRPGHGGQQMPAGEYGAEMKLFAIDGASFLGMRDFVQAAGQRQELGIYIYAWQGEPQPRLAADNGARALPRATVPALPASEPAPLDEDGTCRIRL
jgi:hypothetical protein